MNLESAASAYRNVAFDSAPPIKIVRMMYQGALRFLDEAEDIDPGADPNAFRDRLNRAEAIVVELRVSLDPRHAPEVAGELSRLYRFVEDELFAARDDLDAAPIAGARRVLETLFSAWNEIEVESQPQQG